MNDRKHLSLRIDSELLAKFRHVCDYEGRGSGLVRPPGRPTP